MYNHICIKCGKLYESTTRHKTCSKCRHLGRKVLCPICNEHWKDNRAKSCVRCSNGAGIHGKNWKGGKTYSSDGYVYVYTPDHPKATDKRKHIAEHVLVVEARLGRYLLPGENIHHKNGVKDDNSDSNLELWVTFQPSGQRPEDMLKYADEIIRRYR